MGNSSNVQTNFLGGEWSKVAQGRADKPEYKTALARALNVIPIPPGAAPRRPGFQHVAPTRGGAYARLMSYTFQESAPYNMELTNGFVRFLSGDTPVRTNDDLEITTISTANPAEVTTISAHGWSSLDPVRIFNLGKNNPKLQNREFTITPTGTTTFTLADAITGETIDGSTLGTFVSGTVGRIAELGSAYSASQIADIRKVQINQDFDTNIVLLHESVKPQIVSVVSEPSDDDFAEFEINAAGMQDGPYLDPLKNSYVAPSSVSGLITLTFSYEAYDSTVAYAAGDYASVGAVAYVSLVDQNLNSAPASLINWAVAGVTDIINDGEGLRTSDIGRHIRIYSEPPLWALATTYAAGAVISYNNVVYTSLQGSNLGKTPDAQPTWWGVTPSGALWSWGKIVSLSGGTVTAISQSLGSVIGNLSVPSLAFDGNTNQPMLTDNVAGTSGYIGKNYTGIPQNIASVVVYATTDHGLVQAGTSDPITVNLRGSMTAPASHSAGTLLGTTGSIADLAHSNGTNVIVYNTNDQNTQWNYVWVEILCTTATVVGTAEVVFNSLTATANTGCTIQLLGDPLLYTSAARKWRLGLYSDATGWPRCGTGHEGRLWLSGSAKNRVDASRSNQPFVFSPTETDGSVTASCAMDYTFNADQANSIYWMHAERQGVLCGTDGGEWLLQATSNSNPLTPTSIQASKSTRIKCANSEPAAAGNSLVIIQRYRRKLVEYFADVNAGKFSAPDLSEYAKHMIEDGAREVVYQNELVPIVWTRTDAGELRGMTYKRESLISSSPPEYFGWHRHELGSGRTIVSMCVGPSTDSATDTLSVITVDEDGLHHIEMLTEIKAIDIDIADSWYLDNAIEPSSYDVTPTTVVLNGLWHLNDETVTVFGGGRDLGEYTVSSGSITLTIGTPSGLTLPWVQSFGGQMPFVVGFSYTSQGQTVRPVSMADTGAQAGPAFGKQKRNHQYAVLLESTRDISFGADFNHMKLAKLVTEGGTPLTELELKSGVHTEPLEGSVGLDGMICWQSDGPLPATVVMLGGFIGTADK